MKFLEKDLENIIWENPIDVVYKGLCCYDGFYKFRQLKIGNYGIADIVTIERPLYNTSKRKHVGRIEITVYEIKKNELNESAFFQALRYVKGIQRYLEAKHNMSASRYNIKIVLIGDSLSNDSVSYLPEFINQHKENISLYTYSYGIDGIDFNIEEDYYLIDEGDNFI